MTGRRSPTTTWLILAGFLLLGFPAEGDKVVMDDGRIIEGIILFEDAKGLIIDVHGSRVPVPKSQIKSYERTTGDNVRLTARRNADTYLRSGKYPEAIEAYAQGYADSPTDARARISAAAEEWKKTLASDIERKPLASLESESQDLMRKVLVATGDGTAMNKYDLVRAKVRLAFIVVRLAEDAADKVSRSLVQTHGDLLLSLSPNVPKNIRPLVGSRIDRERLQLILMETILTAHLAVVLGEPAKLQTTPTPTPKTVTPPSPTPKSVTPPTPTPRSVFPPEGEPFTLLARAKELMATGASTQKAGRYTEALQSYRDAQASLIILIQKTAQTTDSLERPTALLLLEECRRRCDELANLLSPTTILAEGRRLLDLALADLARAATSETLRIRMETWLAQTKAIEGPNRESVAGLSDQIQGLVQGFPTLASLLPSADKVTQQPVAEMSAEELATLRTQATEMLAQLENLKKTDPALAGSLESYCANLRSRLSQIEASEGRFTANDAIFQQVTQMVDEATSATQREDFNAAAATLDKAGKTLLALSPIQLSMAQREQRSTLLARIGRETAAVAQQKRTHALEKEVGQAVTRAEQIRQAAEALAGKGDYEKAVTEYERAAAMLAQLDQQSLERIKGTSPGMEARITWELSQAKSVRDQKRLEAGWFKNPTTGELVPPTADSYLLAMRAELGQGREAEAQRWHKRLTEQFGSSAAVQQANEEFAKYYLDQGIALQSRGQLREATAKFTAAIEMGGDGAVAQEAKSRRMRCTAIIRVKMMAKGAVAALVALVLLFAALLVYLKNPNRVQRHSLALVEKTDRQRRSEPAVAHEKYTQIISILTKIQKRRTLSAEGQQALGRACLGDCLALCAQNKMTEAQTRYGEASQYIEIRQEEFLPQLVEIYLTMRQTGDAALSAYCGYLRLPADQADAKVAEQIAAFLENECQIDERYDAERLKRFVRWNQALAGIPGPGPRLVLIQALNAPRQYVLKSYTTIGRGPENDIFIPDGSVSERHAAVSAESGMPPVFTVADLGSQEGTLVGGTRIAAPTRLADGDQVQFGSCTAVFHDQPRPLGRELGWPHFNLGVGFFAQRLFERARFQFEMAKEINPGRADTHCYLGRVHQALGNLDAALHFYAAAVAIAPDHHRAHNSWGKALIQQAEQKLAPRLSGPWNTAVAEAVEHLRRAAELASNNGEYFYDVAQTLVLAEKHREAVDPLRRSLSLNPKHVEGHVLLARCIYKQGDVALARSAAGKALELQPEHVEANLICGHACFEGGDYAGALRHYEQVRTVEARQGKQEYSGGPEFAQRYGRSLFEQGKYVPAFRAFSPMVKQSRSAMFYTGRCYSRTSSFDHAAKVFRWGLQRYGEDAETRYYLASSLGNGGRYPEALEATGPLEAVEGWAARALCLKGRLLARMGRLEEARAQLGKALSTAALGPEVHFELGRLAYVQGDYAAAVRSFDSGLRAAPQDAHLHLWMGRALCAQGNENAAKTHFEAVLKAPESKEDGQTWRSAMAEAHYYLGRIARSHGNYADAMKHFAEARRCGSTSPQLTFDLAASYAENGLYENALAELSSLAMQCPDDRMIAFNLAALSSRMAQRAIENGQYEKAAPLLEQAAERFSAVGADSERAEARQALGEVKFRLGASRVVTGNGRLADGMAALQEALQCCPGDARAQYFLGAGYFKQGDFAKARQAFESISKEGQQSRSVMKALALTLERMGEYEDAKRAWNRLIEGKTAAARIEGKLGLAGFYARREDWPRAAETLHEVLHDEAAQKIKGLAALCKLAVSYFSLAGNHAKAEEAVREHLSGLSSESADAYLGAILAQQNRLADALPALQRAVSADDATQVLQDLYETVRRSLAAQRVLQGDLPGAAEYLKPPPGSRRRPNPETEAFAHAIRSAMLLTGARGDVDEESIKTYRNAYNAQTDNPKVLCNLTILCHRMAIDLETHGKERKADPYWREANGYWEKIIEGQDRFWDQYITLYNNGRNRRDRIKDTDIDALKKHVRDRVADVHVEFAKEYAAEGHVGDARRHVEYAKPLDRDNTIRSAMAAAFIREAGNRKQQGKESEFFSLAELAHDLAPNDPDIRRAFAIAVFNKGTDCLTRGELSGAEKYYDWAQRLEPTMIKEPMVRQMLGQLYLAKANEAAGRQNHYDTKRYIEQALEFDPTLYFKVPGLKEACAALGIHVGGLRAILEGMMR